MYGLKVSKVTMGCGLAIQSGYENLIRCWPLLFLVPIAINLHFLKTRVPKMIYKTVSLFSLNNNS